MRNSPIVSIQPFIETTRDTGYKSTGSAIAEFVDNALEAAATSVRISIRQIERKGERDLVIQVIDDGCGMTPQVLASALQFGGSTRFNSRKATGRYGMGLPNGGLSQARRLEVYTWTRSSEIWNSYLDVDEIVFGSMRTVPRPRLKPISVRPDTPSGSIIVLRKCDRVDTTDVPALEVAIAQELGRTFRNFLFDEKQITINGRNVLPIDPLFVAPGSRVTGAKLYGPPLEFKLRVPFRNAGHPSSSIVSVAFSELPIEQWRDLSNDQKSKMGISKGAGVSVLRAGREIDVGWYFMGSKRKENYDDWWRCEVSFSPELDELFGVTHSKQTINPTSLLSSVLTPEIERIARELNNRVRQRFAAIKSTSIPNNALKRFELKDHLLEPPTSVRRGSAQNRLPELKLLRKRGDGINGLRFSLTHKPEDHNCFFSAQLRKGVLSLNINQCHPFYSALYAQLQKCTVPRFRNMEQHMLVLLISFARAELVLSGPKEREIMRRLREVWSDTVAAFLS